jgi:hypothetical protein
VQANEDQEEQRRERRVDWQRNRAAGDELPQFLQIAHRIAACG